MTFNPRDNVVAQIIESYKPFRDALPAEKRQGFDELMNHLYEFIEAINVKDEPFAEETAIVSLVLKQHLIIEELKQEIARLKQVQK